MANLPDVITRKVVARRKDGLVFPEMYGAVYIQGPKGEEYDFAEMFARCRLTLTRQIDLADIVVFTGGADVDPQLYGETQHASTYCIPARDTDDMKTYQYCLEKGIPMFGVCRGAQFLAVMNGHKLFQDIEGHNREHGIFDTVNKKVVAPVSSVHHQAVIPGKGMEVLAETTVHGDKWINAETKIISPEVIAEAFWIRDTACLGVQGHPEYPGYNYYTLWCCKLIEEYIAYNPDITSINNVWRMKPDLIAQRAQKNVVIIETEVEVN